MSKRMVTYSVTDDDKIAAINGHDVGSGGVGNKSISRRMITYKVDDTGKIISIDGHELNGGGGGDYEIKPLEVTENGVYDVTGEAYKPVRVNVPQTAQSGTLKALLDATQTAGYLFNGYKGTSVDELISYNDTSNVTSTYKMFNECSNLTSIPNLNTSKNKSAESMFYNCRNLTTIPLLDMSNVVSVNFMFGYCTSLLSIPKLNLSRDLYSLNSMFYGCTNLVSIPQLNVSRIDNMSNTFYNCTNLEEIHMIGMQVNFNISASTKFTRDALLEILNNLATVTSTQTLTMGTTNLAKLTDEDKSIATNKGWTLA